METRAGTSVLLSLCIVAIAAVALYRPDPPRTPSPIASESVVTDAIMDDPGALVDASSELPEPTAGIPLPAPSPATATPAARPVEVPMPSRPASAAKKVAATRRRPDSAFTTVGVGETLPAIAVRVYGTTDATETLFRANRDVLSDPDDPLQVGGMLRTP
jgi:nucleoid-associated protein YgaU